MRQIKDLVEIVSNKLQGLESLLSNVGIESVKIQLPRGILRKAKQFRSELFFLDDDILKRNLAYHLLLTDLFNWLLKRFNIVLTAQEMLIKEAICLYGSICAGVLTRVAGRRGINPSINLLNQRGIIENNLKTDLEWLWNLRCKEHIENLRYWEYQKYSISDYKKAALTWRQLKECLQKARQQGDI